ncbi:APC family permease [Thermoleophilia bacterium SCSIO 60948]|nr:APC family permease [Thermoleophilia bacterium SCSIO 60948]
MESASIAASPATGEDHVDKGLKKGSVGFVDQLSIGLASTAPAYSLAAVIGSIVVLTGVHAPGTLLLSFVPMFFIATAFLYMNRVDPDCGTTFSWVTRALGPYLGWMGGWAISVTGILVIGSLADVSAFYIFDLLGFDELKRERFAIVGLALLIMGVMTAICVIGTEASARLQRVLTLGQVGIMLLFALVAFVRLAIGDAPERAITPELSWISPFGEGVEYSSLLSGLLLGVFIYWGWESAVNLAEESDNETGAGVAGLMSTLILLGTYVAVAIALIATAGLEKIERFDDNAGVLGAVAQDVLGPLAFLVVVAIIVSGISSAQTTILPGSRTSLSMAAAGALPKKFAQIHPRFLTPDFGTITIGVLAAVWYVGASLVSDNFLFDSLSALSLLIAFYYALTGIACAIYWRRELLRSVKNFLFIGLAPLIGALLLAYLLGASAIEVGDPANSYTGQSVFGIGVPLFIALFFFVSGLVLMILWRVFARPEYFSRRPFQAVPRDVAEGRRRVEAIGASEDEVPG